MFEQPVPPPSRELSDEESIAQLVIKELIKMPPVQSKNPKIAFMFLTPGSLPFEKLWDKFFQVRLPSFLSLFLSCKFYHGAVRFAAIAYCISHYMVVLGHLCIGLLGNTCLGNTIFLYIKYFRSAPTCIESLATKHTSFHLALTIS